jgi:E3 ubiquitin-protein ligase MARCH1/8
MSFCELCKFEFIIEMKVRPLRDWKRLKMKSNEQFKMLITIFFHLAAVCCVVWSLYVLSEKLQEKINKQLYDWAFWTKLFIVVIGFSGGLIFLFIQFKMYYEIFKRWCHYNRIIIIQPITDEILKNSIQQKVLNEKKTFFCYFF